MSEQAMLPCLKCGKTLPNVDNTATNQPYGGTEFRTYGHYGSTFWDSFEGEEIVINVCDDCLRANIGRIARHKRFKNIHVNFFRVGREWMQRQMVPYFEGPEDDDSIKASVDDLAEFEGITHVQLDPAKVAYAREHQHGLESESWDGKA